MRKGRKTVAVAVLLVIVACALAAGGYFLGKTAGEKPLLEAQERLYTLNRAGIAGMTVGNGPVYVIGPTGEPMVPN